MSLNAPKRTLPVTGIILAGGKSRRMGQNKALLPLGEDSLIAHVIRRMRRVTDELLLITNAPAEYTHLGLPMHSDIIPDAGALGGIYTGLTYASHDVAVCVACDSPFLQPKLLSYLISILGEYDAVMPYTESRNRGIEVTNPSHSTDQMTLQTLCAVYAKRCLPVIEQMLNEPDLRVHALRERANILTLAPEIWKTYDAKGYSFFNINTPEDFEKAQTIL
ncbi:molybdenum cofactor guanylyltransferase [Candidatus Poribacteria bacterium]|nr:molybdenum cofactor guanylyltransferase [Candidatus Poribacteria bacterium]MYH84103.1 molybdenum cofactor guanylyltransferase [Candidatus Poribacteria bacterium]MYK96276.1 molybdenum cofactor guanylyltransferase [Candidatus Poribacteria bacterium]